MSYQIAWRNLDSGQIGLGPKKFEDINAVEVVVLVEQLNQEHPGFEHVMVESGAKPIFKSDLAVDPSTIFVPFADRGSIEDL